MKIEGINSFYPKIGEEVTLSLNDWDNKKVYLLNKNGEIWCSFEMGANERLSLLKELFKTWLGGRI